MPRLSALSRGGEGRAEAQEGGGADNGRPVNQALFASTLKAGTTGAPILASTPAFVECTLESTVEIGDHSVFVGKVVEAGIAKNPEGRADDATLWLKELGDKVFYGG